MKARRPALSVVCDVVCSHVSFAPIHSTILLTRVVWTSRCTPGLTDNSGYSDQAATGEASLTWSLLRLAQLSESATAQLNERSGRRTYFLYLMRNDGMLDEQEL